MKSLFPALTILILTACNHPQPLPEKIHFFYLGGNQERLTIEADTFDYQKGNKITSDDELIAERGFMYGKKPHFIKMYSSDGRAPIDAGGLKYTLDSIGVIYGRSTTWGNFGRLCSDNDSINDLINNAYGYIIMNPDFRCYHCRGENTFVPPPPNH